MKIVNIYLPVQNVKKLKIEKKMSYLQINSDAKIYNIKKIKKNFKKYFLLLLRKIFL